MFLALDKKNMWVFDTFIVQESGSRMLMETLFINYMKIKIKGNKKKGAYNQGKQKLNSSLKVQTFSIWNRWSNGIGTPYLSEENVKFNQQKNKPTIS